MNMAVDPEDFWRKQINDLSASLPDDGEMAPEIESIKKKPTPIKDGSRKGVLQQIITIAYIFTDLNGQMYTGDITQQTKIHGNMTLARALKIMQNDKLV